MKVAMSRRNTSRTRGALGAWGVRVSVDAGVGAY